MHHLAKLPGLGPRSAQRIALHLLKKREAHLHPLMISLQQVSDHIQTCDACGNLDTTSPCHICADLRRDTAQLCVVADVADVWALERAHIFKGHYHVLGGVLSALDGVGPDDLRLGTLRQRVQQLGVREVILALAATLEAQSTAHVIRDQLADLPVAITRLAHGLPVGGELDYMDEGTLVAALQARR
ncbi:MAG: recombination protein RecR [Alphaproteobacteria bacterium]|nr:recombination protein RecR [Alphaproteobacteria bacterium]